MQANRSRAATVFAVLALFSAFLSAERQTSPQNQKKTRSEEAEDYFQKWLREDVVYIITDEEKDVFEKLTTPEEKEQFIEQFWIRRDPDLTTGANEFKTEHYRRIAYANEWFTSGRPGWKTDRGRVYIIHGPPDQVFKRPAGGTYDRPMHEGGGNTAVFPFETWNYYFIEGVGEDVELEFIDPTYSGEYRLALNPEEKDALLHIPGAGLTYAEEMGLARRPQRPFFSPGRREKYPLQTVRAKDNPFARYETFQMVQAPQAVKYRDLQELVKVNVGFQTLPVKVTEHYFRLSRDRVLAPITVEVKNQDLVFESDYGVRTARVAVYGLVRTLTDRLITEFEDEVTASFEADGFEEGLLRRSVYQKTLILEHGRYKLDLIVKDLQGGLIGAERRGLVTPSFEPEKLTLSSLLLADGIEPLAEIPTEERMFVLGDVKVLPNASGRFPQGRPVGLYFQVYGAALDQALLEPSLEVGYEVRRGDEILLGETDPDGRSIQYSSLDRLVLIRTLPTQGWEPGRYRVIVTARDRISGQTASVSKTFQIE